MRKLITITMLLLVVMACKKENSTINKFKETLDKAKETTQDLKNVNKIIKGAEDTQQNIQKLSKLTPLSKEIFKTWMPSEIGDLKRIKYEIGKQMGFAKISNAKLEFKTADKTKGISLNITDGAGNGASMISMTNLMLQADVDSEDETGYKKTQTFDGQKIMVEYSNPKYANRSLFKYVVNNRIYIETRGWGMKPDELWGYLKQLEIEKLTKK